MPQCAQRGYMHWGKKLMATLPSCDMERCRMQMQMHRVRRVFRVGLNRKSGTEPPLPAALGSTLRLREQGSDAYPDGGAARGALLRQHAVEDGQRLVPPRNPWSSFGGWAVRVSLASPACEVICSTLPCRSGMPSGSESIESAGQPLTGCMRSRARRGEPSRIPGRDAAGRTYRAPTA